ncbi:SWIM zinc finger family protein [Streptomyces sp. R35]|uniref:SWIM zinc finger family protein n=1 Tax=Streptomyces sp. R35 TaxID=3238630 RepID=A0AB39SHI2_9ACTN
MGRSAEGVSGGARPGDIAREALRAARDEARRARTEGADAATEGATGAGTKGVEARRRPAEPAPTASRTRRNPRGEERGTRARDLRDLLAGAFQLPGDTESGGAAAAGPSARADDAVSGHRAELASEPGEAISDSRSVRRGGAGEATSDSHSLGLGGAGEATSDSHSLRLGGAGEVAPGSHPTGPQDSREVTSDPNPSLPGAVREVTADLPSAQPGEEGDAFLRPAPAPSGPAREAHPGQPPVPPGTHRARLGTPLERPGAEPRSVPPAGRLPRSMASPGRDGELRRTFPAFPARVSDADAFAETWWGNAWVTALEEGALDAARLARGRAYAGHGYVDAITVTPGLVLAYVHGSRPRPYRVQVSVRTLSDGDWDRFLDAAAERPGHIAALLDKEMPKSLAECGVALLPGPGELEPHCSCPDFGHPCKHAAALCYQMARLLDEDPFVLLLLRGRGERELLDALSRRNAARAARAAQDQEPAPLPGVRARDAVARRTLPPLPAPLPPPAHPEQPPTYPGAPGGPDPFALDQLATDAAVRAHALLTTGRDPVAELTLWQDAVRLAAARPGSGLTAATRALYSSLASATGRTPADLARAVAAWRQGGFEALSVLEEPWDPPAGRFDRARPLLLAADLPAFRPWRNQLTHPRGHAQLRLGHNGLWYAYESEPGHDDWWPRGTPDLDPVGALTGLGAPGEL